MLFSIFTPTHRADYLPEVYDSLLRQNNQNWEWIIVPNGDAGALPGRLQADNRVSVIPAPADMRGIGALKRFACENCNGEYFVELDHDDLLTDNALNTLEDWINREDKPGFLYSDFVNFRADGTCQVYGKENGWESYEMQHRGQTYTAMRAFAADASSVSLIFFAPNHIRVWRRDVYSDAGGHNPRMEICDDQDLICRTYLTGARMVHVPEPLYLYRLQEGGSNTYLERNGEIQKKQQQVSNQYHYALIEQWCIRNALPMYDLGGRFGCPPQYKSVDYTEADVECDIRQGLPFDDDSVGCIRAYDFLEHIPPCADSGCQHGEDGAPLCTVGLMNEIYRVLAPGGWLVSRTPSTDGRGAFQDPTHCSFWNPNSFWYYTNRDQAKFVPGVKCRFQDNRIWQSHPTDWHKKHEILYVFADLVALKGQKQPGITKI